MNDYNEKNEGAGRCWRSWQEWQGLAFVRIRPSVRSPGGFRWTMLP